MAIMKINPTRMELIKLKRKLVTAKRGHKLLKEKRDGLMKEFMAIIREVRDLRQVVEEKLATGFKSYLFAGADMGQDAVREALMVPSKKIKLEADTKNVMSVNVPVFSYKEEGDWLSYGLAGTSGQLDESLKIFSDSLKDLVELAQKEHSAKLMAAEIEKTRRRVNALEYVFIPDMQETLKYITAKLNEQERASVITTMKIKQEMELAEKGG